MAEGRHRSDPEAEQLSDQLKREKEALQEASNATKN
jgi:hypothetical protein